MTVQSRSDAIFQRIARMLQARDPFILFKGDLMKRILSMIACLMLVSFCLLTGCKKRGFAFPEPSSELYDGAFNSVTQKMIYANTEYMVDLGTLTVLENRKAENARYIHLPVLRVRSNAEKPLEPVFCLTGGPGMSNIGHVGMKWYLMPDHDIVMVGYRGVDGSSVLSCPEVAKAVKGRGRLFSESSMRAIGQAWTRSAKRFREEGVDINAYTIPDVIEDNERARKALGYERINLKSASYGTRVAYFYGLIHPGIIHRSAMVSVNPPGRFVWERDVFDDQLRMYSGLWAADSAANNRSKDLYSDIMKAMRSMPDRWLFLPIDEGKVRCVAFSMLFNNTAAGLVFDSFIAASQGDYSGLALMSLAYDFVLPGMFTWGELACKAVSADFDSTRDYISDMAPNDRYPMGSPMSELLWGPTKYGRWPVRLIPDQYRRLRQSDVETLLISGSIDVGTPTCYAVQDMLPVLTNGHHVILKERGHIDMEWPNPEACRRLISSFFQTGVPDESLNGFVPVNFTVSWGFPVVAKLSVAILMVIILGFIVALLLVIRRILRKRNQRRQGQSAAKKNRAGGPERG